MRQARGVTPQDALLQTCPMQWRRTGARGLSETKRERGRVIDAVPYDLCRPSPARWKDDDAAFLRRNIQAALRVEDESVRHCHVLGNRVLEFPVGSVLGHGVP